MTSRLHAGFLRMSETVAERVAVEAAGESLTYAALRHRALAMAATLQRRTPDGGSRLAAVLALRTPTAFAGILGTLCSGRGYVPLNRTFPPARTRWMLQNADCRAMVVDGASEAHLAEVLPGVDNSLLILLPDSSDASDFAARWPQHEFVTSSQLDAADSCTLGAPAADDIAYLLYTSGSTGAPKGVPVTHGNASSFVELMVKRYGVRSDDRFSQTFDPTFDLSVFDMFVAWTAGARVCCPSADTLLNPDRFIRDTQLTIWFSVPSVGAIMKRLRALKPGRYPSLRAVLFCGEPLTQDVAEAWSVAAPNAVIENLYGPTELTIACSSYRWNSATSPAECENGIVPIGEPFPGMTAAVVDDELRPVSIGCVGELAMDGPQRTPGYWRNQEATDRSYVSVEGLPGTFYRTGDRVRRKTANAPLTYVGRSDHQVKVLGYRIELGEIESRLRVEPGVESAVAVPWPITPSGPGGIVAFVTGHGLETAAIQSRLRLSLQPYAVPKAIHVLPALPHNANGKVDRRALQALLEQGLAG